ncbi:protein serine/threonine phosphatase 2C, partial [Aureobasidium melanogenum]
MSVRKDSLQAATHHEERVCPRGVELRLRLCTMICVGKAENLEIRAIVPIVRDRDKMRHTSEVRDQQRDLERLKNVGETTVDMYSLYTHQSLLDRWLRDIANPPNQSFQLLTLGLTASDARADASLFNSTLPVRSGPPSPKKMTSIVRSSRYLREYGLGRVSSADSVSVSLPPRALRARVVDTPLLLTNGSTLSGSILSVSGTLDVESRSRLVGAEPRFEPGLVLLRSSVSLLVKPHSDQTDDLFIREHLPQTICGHNDKVTLFRLNLCGGDDRLGSDEILRLLGPLVDSVSKCTARLEAAENTTVVVPPVWSTERAVAVHLPLAPRRPRTARESPVQATRSSLSAGARSSAANDLDFAVWTFLTLSCVGRVQLASDIGDEGLAEFGRCGPATVVWMLANGSRGTTKHPITTFGLTRNRLGDVDDLLCMVVFDGVVARDLDDIVANDTGAAANQVGFLVGAQLLGGLLCGQHFEDLATVIVGLLVQRLVIGYNTASATSSDTGPVAPGAGGEAAAPPAATAPTARETRRKRMDGGADEERVASERWKTTLPATFERERLGRRTARKF